MEIRRFFVNPSQIHDGKIIVDGDEFLHMTKVLRYKVGYKAIVCANDGIERLCTIEEIDKTHALLSIDEQKTMDSKGVHVTLYAGLLKNNKLDFVVQKGVELGVDRIVPFTSQNTAETRFQADRMRKIALESAKQCGSTYLSEVENLTTFEDMLKEFSSYDRVLFAYEDERKTRIKDCNLDGKRIAVVVGAEGGFTPDEAARAKECGAQIISLGKRILRAETASIVTCALLLNELGELDYE